ncbi:phosphoribosylformylglycinamidine synthase [bacterium]|nr:phosphoribosylformylglycinamidine synthase subunit PurS [bacterium]RKZ28098.1 MAG: phosphoribosylformylglycinamidine synthase [bacterium]
MKLLVEIVVKRKKGVSDPEGNTISEALQRLGYDSIDKVRTAKLFSIEIDADNLADAKKTVMEIADKVLANPVIENFSIIDIEEMN